MGGREGKGLMNIAFVGMSTGLQFNLGNDYVLVSLLCLLKVYLLENISKVEN